MKRRILSCSIVLLSVISSFSLKAQSNSEEVDLYQSVFGMEKKAIVANFMGLEPADSFWALYDAYETERKEYGKDRIIALSLYVENYDNLDDEKYDEVIKMMTALRKANDKLIDSYYKKIKKSSGSKVAAQFFQLEAYFISEIRASLMSGIPLIGEFEN